MSSPEQLQLGTILLAAFAAAACFVYGLFAVLRGSGSMLTRRLGRSNSNGELAREGPAALEVLRDRRLSNNVAFNLILRAHPLALSIAEELKQAHVALTVGEYLLLRALCSVVAAVLLTSLGGSWLAAVPGAGLGYFAPKVYVSYRRNQRIHRIEGQLVEALTLSANSLRAGWGFMQAMVQVAQDMPAPISDEFTQVFQEVGIGATQENAIQNLIQRVPSYDLELVMTAVLIQRQSGGNLAEMMDNIAFTIRERIRLIADIASITAESTMSMWLLSLLPVGLLMLMAVTQPDYMLPFMTDPRGRMLLVGAGFMEIVGVLVMRKLADIRV